MRRRLPAESDPEVLSNPVAERVLTRASELDAALRGGTLAVSELRSAAVEAGISPEAFDAALAEVRDAEAARVPNVEERPPARRRWWAVVASALVLIAVGTLGVARVAPPDAARGPMTERTFLLRCLSVGQASALIRPAVDARVSTVYSSAPGVLTVRAPSTQIGRVQSVLDEFEDPRAPACSRTPPATTR